VDFPRSVRSHDAYVGVAADAETGLAAASMRLIWFPSKSEFLTPIGLQVERETTQLSPAKVDSRTWFCAENFIDRHGRCGRMPTIRAGRLGS
jgi:hypothetical protein